MAVKERKTSVGSASFKRPYISEARARDPADRTAEANPFRFKVAKNQRFTYACMRRYFCRRHRREAVCSNKRLSALK